MNSLKYKQSKDFSEKSTGDIKAILAFAGYKSDKLNIRVFCIETQGSSATRITMRKPKTGPI